MKKNSMWTTKKGLSNLYLSYLMTNFYNQNKNIPFTTVTRIFTRYETIKILNIIVNGKKSIILPIFDTKR